MVDQPAAAQRQGLQSQFSPHVQDAAGAWDSAAAVGWQPQLQPCAQSWQPQFVFKSFMSSLRG